MRDLPICIDIDYNTVMGKYSVYPKRRDKRLWIVGLLTVAIVGVSATSLYYHKRLQAAKSTAAVAVQKPVQAEPKNIDGRYLLHGTTTWSRGIEQTSRRRDGSYDYAQPFGQLSTFEADKYDAWLTSFECPITDAVVPFRTQVDNLLFNCRPEFLPEATKYFDIFSLANNHTGDQNGAVGLKETRDYLQKAGVQYFGNFDPAVTDDICEVVSLPVRVTKSNKEAEPAQLPAALCGWHYFMRPPAEGELEVMRQYAASMPVFAFVEMGAEYQATASQQQQTIAKAIIDEGADFVIANNPHWVQNTEVYKDKLIVYATGNFIFDQLQPEERRSASIDVSMQVAYDQNSAAWLELGKSCKVFQDDCLQKAQQQKLQKIRPKFTFGVIAGQGGYQVQTHRADPATQTAVEQRMNWQQTLEQLRR
ncbi:hypothetical protein EKI60_01695 [Candidatus Saccharibacteria bacterium]|nr:MAG: hypothetical protein EKI60_01695 [Candidatus Saccharibacteria bacterium]